MEIEYTAKFKKAYSKVLKTLEKEGLQNAKLCFRDEMLRLGHEERVDNLYRVKDKLSAKAVPFRRNSVQRRLAQEKSGRDIVLKTRQMGITTDSCIVALDLALWEPNMATGIMAHKQTVVGTIFTDLVKFSHTWFKKDWGKLYAPRKDSDSSTALRFKDDGLGRSLNSSMQVLFDFRGKTVNFLHISEAAYIDQKRLAGSLSGVPANGQVILESTANGMGGEFHRQYQNYLKLGKQAPYKAFFFPWFEFYPENLEDPKWTFDESSELSEYELKLLEDYPQLITKKHLAWRRWCIEANCQGSLETFEQEYPSNDEDCFLSGEASIFGRTITKAQRKNCFPPVSQGFLLSENNKKFTFHEDEKGPLAIWFRPNPSNSYVIGADSSAGMGKDKAAAYVKDQKTKRIVARLWGDLAPDVFAKELYKLGNYFNKAWINPEVNNHGGVVIHVLKEMLYGNIYKRQVIDEITKRPTKKLGFLTTSDSKRLLIEKFKIATREGGVIITDTALIAEMTTFMQYASTTGRTFKMEASPGAHDDLVIAAALCEEMDSTRQVSYDDHVAFTNPFHWGRYDSDTGFLS